jgi:DNA-binding MarR family transcriptional regulator
MAYEPLERDPIVTGSNRATVPLGRGFALWQRMNAGQHLVWVDDAEGRPRALTPRQAKVLYLALEMTSSDRAGLTMRAMATALQVAPSTVSRALTKLASWGLIAYVVGRGRWAGLVIFRRATDDGMERFRKAAQARVRRWSEAVRRRLSRLEFNVAPIALEGDRGVDSLYYWSTQVTNYKGATLTAQRPWTVEELRDAGII